MISCTVPIPLLNMARRNVEDPKLEDLSEREREAVTTVFRSFETGLREATIYSKVHRAEKVKNLSS